ncbi:MAG: FapA family protein, partial [Spirochaetaceae bacterium]|nr:FapA family protein [Spirochaetaceae bacterium]
MEADHPERHGFSLRYQDGWAVLIVPPKSKRPRPVYTDDVAARMKILDIPPVPARTIREIIEKGSGRPEALVEWPSGAHLSAWVDVNVSEDGMEARARVRPARPGGAPLDRDIIHAALERAGVTKGVVQGAVRALIRGEGVRDDYPVAKGRRAEAGIAERTECLFITDRGKPWKELSGGRIDLKELNFIQNRKAGDLLA